MKILRGKLWFCVEWNVWDWSGKHKEETKGVGKIVFEKFMGGNCTCDAYNHFYISSFATYEKINGENRTVATITAIFIAF